MRENQTNEVYIVEQDKSEKISYFVLEGVMTQLSLTIKRLVIILITVLILWAATIAGFMWYISLPIEEVETVTVENDTGNATYIGNDMNGDFNYGENN